MANWYKIPLSNSPQKLTISLGGKTYKMMILWNTIASIWVLDIYDAFDVLLISGIPLVAGSDLLEQYQYLGFGGHLTALEDNDPNLPPSFATLGSTGNLYFVTE